MDTNIIVSAVLGLRSRQAFQSILGRRDLVISERGRQEAIGRVSDLGATTPGATRNLADLLDVIAVADATQYSGFVEMAARTLRLAVASRNGSTNDAHILALAWTLDADIWSHDRDFAGTGWPSWSSANLRTALADA